MKHKYKKIWHQLRIVGLDHANSSGTTATHICYICGFKYMDFVFTSTIAINLNWGNFNCLMEDFKFQIFNTPDILPVLSLNHSIRLAPNVTWIYIDILKQVRMI